MDQWTKCRYAKVDLEEHEATLQREKEDMLARPVYRSFTPAYSLPT